MNAIKIVLALLATCVPAPNCPQADYPTCNGNGYCVNSDGNYDSNWQGVGSRPDSRCSADYCFPSDALVTKADGTLTCVDALKEGDEIIAATDDGTLTTDTVSLLSIAKPEAEADFITLATAANTTITLTGNHHVPIGDKCCAKLKLAEAIAIGETVWVVRSGATVATTVTSKTERVRAKGLHSPVLTGGGFPVVDGIVTSFDSYKVVTLAKYTGPAIIAACKAAGTCENIRSALSSTDAASHIK